MKRMIGLLRAVNVGGTGKLPMSELVQMCVDAGFENVRTYIASGNVVFSTGLAEKAAKKALEDRLQKYAGKPISVFMRDVAHMRRVLDANPFADREAKYTVAIFLDECPPQDALAHAKGANGEDMQLGEREIYVHYGKGMGQSKLRIPAAAPGTARNMNTVAKLVAMAEEL
jgi:uncharacterized protein (DUF1697 family)